MYRKIKRKILEGCSNRVFKRISGYAKVSITELKEVKLPNNPSEADEKNVIKKEGHEILSCVNQNDYIIALAIEGKNLNSLELAEKIEELALKGISDIIFIIGGSLGLSDEVIKRADFKLSFSRMTFPHQMMRVILLEQIYRSFKIIRNESYHK